MDEATTTLGWAVVEWINATFGKQVQNIEELLDGVVLFEILCEIDAQWFESAAIKPDPAAANNWVLRFNNLKKIHRLLIRYFEELLNQNTVALEPANLSAIAKDSDVSELLKLIQLVLAIAVQCEKNQEYVAVIQELDQSHQHALMVGIEQVMSGLQRETALQKSLDDELADDAAQDSAALLTQKLELEKANKDLNQQLSDLREKLDEAMGEREEMTNKLKLLESAAAPQASGSSKSDVLYKAEIEKLKQELYKSESKRAEQESLLEKMEAIEADLGRKSEELSRKLDEAKNLKDQLDEAKHTVEKLKKNEGMSEKYKKKVEECNDLRRQIKLLEEQVQVSEDKSNFVESEFLKASGMQGDATSLRQQIAALEKKASTLTEEKNKLEFELREMKAKLEVMDADRDRNQELIHTLEEKIRELELEGSGSAPGTSMAGFGAELHNASLADLQAAVGRLERENKQLRDGSTGLAEKERVALLESLLDDANKAKAKFEQDYLKAHQLNIKYENDLKRAAQSGPEGTTMSLALRVKLQEAEQENSNLKKKIAETEALLDDTSKQFDFFKNSLDPKMLATLEAALLQSGSGGDSSAAKETVAKLETKAAELEEQNKSQLQQIHKLLVEKDELNTKMNELKDSLLNLEKLTNELRTSSSASGSKEQTGGDNTNENAELKEKLKAAATKIVSLHEQNITLQKAVKKMKEHIIHLDETAKARRSNTQDAEVHSEAVRSLENELKAKTELLERIKNEFEEYKSTTKRELRLMTSAWYDVGMQSQRKTTQPTQRGAASISNLSSASWLGQQRSALSQSKARR